MKMTRSSSLLVCVQKCHQQNQFSWNAQIVNPTSLFSSYLFLKMCSYLFLKMSVSDDLHMISLLVTFITLVLVHDPASVFANDHEQFTNCGQPFQCGNISEIGYPFWEGSRPSSCGYPGFNLRCSGQVANISIEQLSYQILGINNESRILRLARSDYTQNICPTVYRNTTLDSNLFTYASDTVNTTLYYNCATSQFVPIPNITNSSAYQFTCNTQVGYFHIGDLTSSLGSADAATVLAYLKTCENNVIVPGNQSFIQTINRNNANSANLVANLNQGFGVEWDANYTRCNDCKTSGGQCGYSQGTNSFACYCSDQAYDTICGVKSESASRNQTPIGIGLAIFSAAIFGICLGFCLCFPRTARSACGKATTLCCRRRKGNGKIEAFILNYQSQIPKRFSHSDVKRMTNSFADKLGHGGFGSVYKGKLPDGRLVAVKVLKKSKGDGEEFINEVASIGRTSHVNVVTLLGFCYKGTKRALIYDYMPNGSLDKFIGNQQSPSTGLCLEWKTLYEIAVGIARGLEYLHRGSNTRIVHFDIKPHNILLDQDFCPKISDFGLAKLCKGKESKVSMLGARGTVGYIAPEVFCRNFGGVSYKSDVYSYGMMVLEMVGAKQNVNIGASESSEGYFPDWIYKQLESGEISRLHGGITEEEEETIKRMILIGLWCIQTNPSDRPSMTKVVEMLEGSLESLQVPPKPFLSSPAKPPVEFSSISSSQTYSCSQRDEEVALSLDKNEL